MRVRIVLRDRASGKYYRAPAEWVTNAYDALTFANIIDAEAFCADRGLAHVQMIQQSGYFFRAPRYRPTHRGEGRQTA